MISFLEGKLELKTKNYAVVNVAGIGYRVFMSGDTLSKLPQQGSSIKLYTSSEVREDAMDLYGFLTREELDFYEMLRTVSGVGPKTALAILSLAPVKITAGAIANKNIAFVSKVSGIGKKIAEKIILELKDKTQELAGATRTGSGFSQTDADLIEALNKMGYGTKEAAEALSHVPGEIKDEQSRLKEALKLLNRK